MTMEPGEGRGPSPTVEDVHAEYRREEPWAQALYEHQPVVLDLSRPKLVGLAAIGLGIGLLGSSFWIAGSNDPVMWLGGPLMAALGLAMVVRFAQLFSIAKGALQVDPFGVRIRPGHREHAWRDLVGAKTWRMSHNHFVALLLTERAAAERYAHRSTTYRRVRRVLTWPQGEDVVALPHPLAIDRERFAYWLCMEAVYRNPELRSQAEAHLAQGVSPPPEPR